MNEKDTRIHPICGLGGTAFPVSNGLEEVFTDGMTLLDYFAGQAMTGYAANERVMGRAIDDWEENGGLRPTCTADWLAGLAYEVAESMVAEKRRREGGAS